MPDKKAMAKFTPFLLMLGALLLGFQFLGPAGGFVVLLFCIGWLFWRRRASMHYGVARRCFDTGDMETARMRIAKAVAAEPDNSILRASCGFMYLKMGSPVDAERMLNVALSVAKTPVEKYNAKTIMALLLWKKGQLDDAIALLESVMENYKTTTTYSTMGFFMVARGDVDKALAFNREAYEFNANNPVILDNYGSALLMAGQLDEALKIYEALMPKKPTFPDAYFNHGKLLEALGRDEDALAMYNTAASRKFWFTSTITREEVDERLEALEEKLGMAPALVPAQVQDEQTQDEPTEDEQTQDEPTEAEQIQDERTKDEQTER